MKRSVVILILGVILAIMAYCGFYFGNTASTHSLLKNEAPELAWLKKEFNLTDAEFQRISNLHENYMPHCEKMCRLIDAKNAEIKTLLAATNTLTPEIEQKLNEAGQVRVECQKMMLEHFLEVSRAMPQEQGKRYLAWVQEKTFLPNRDMDAKSASHE